MKRKTGKIIRAVFNTFIIILLSAVVFLTVSVIISGNKGYTPIFGNAYVSVQSRSMEGEKPAGNDEKPDGFNKGDIIKIFYLVAKSRILQCGGRGRDRCKRGAHAVARIL